MRARVPRIRPGAALVLLSIALLGLPAAGADVVAPKKGKKITGAVVKNDASGVVINIYNSKNPGVTNPKHVFSFPADRVKKVELEPRPEVEVHRLIAAAKGDAAKLCAAGYYAKEHKLKHEARMAFALSLAADPEHAPALKGIGGKTKLAKERTGNPYLDTELMQRLQAYCESDDPAARTKIGAELAGMGFKAKPYELERYRRSMLQPKGYQNDRPISWLSEQHPGATYALYVPSGYVPWKAWPLIIGLHGGGADGKAGDEVVGSGLSAMNFYRQQASRHGYIVACPNALMAPWGRKPNEEYVRALIEELKLLYHVDIDRIYMTGHSMGGFGTWALGPRLSPQLAAISPMAGGGGTVQPLLDSSTPVFIYHSADDYVRVDSDRAQAKRLLGTGHDFIYTEFPNAGHGFPASIQEDLFTFFGPRRNVDKKRKTAWPRSSFLGKVSKEEKTYYGDPMAEIDGVVPDLKSWTRDLRTGGGKAHAAVGRLAEVKPEGAAAVVAKVLGSTGLAFDSRAYAARALGQLGDPAGLPALRSAVGEDAAKEQSMIAVEAAKALATLRDREGIKALARGVRAWLAYFESKRSSDRMTYSDWRRSVNTLAAVLDAWGACAGPGDDAGSVTAAVVDAIFVRKVAVRTSERVPQDPGRARVALAKALGRALAATNADAETWGEVLELMADDGKALNAAKAFRK